MCYLCLVIWQLDVWPATCFAVEEVNWEIDFMSQTLVIVLIVRAMPMLSLSVRTNRQKNAKQLRPDKRSEGVLYQIIIRICYDHIRISSAGRQFKVLH